jgi:hypothetical protein
LPIQKPYLVAYLYAELNAEKDSLIPLTRSKTIGKYILSLAKTFHGAKRRNTDNIVQCILPSKTDIRFKGRYHYLNYEGEQLLNDFLSSMFLMRIMSIVTTARQMGLSKKDALYAYITSCQVQNNKMNYDQMAKAIYRFDQESKKVLAELVFDKAKKKFDI